MPTLGPPSVRFVFNSSYKGGLKEWSTRIYFEPDILFSDDNFDALAADQHAYVLPSIPPYCTYKELVCYRGGSDLPVRTIDVNQVGTFAPTTPTPTPLETAAYFRFTTAQRTARNHPVYLGQYIHDVMYQPGTDHELLNTDQMENIRQWLARWVSGINIGGTLFHKCNRSSTAVATGLHVPLYTTHRDFPI